MKHQILNIKQSRRAFFLAVVRHRPGVLAVALDVDVAVDGEENGRGGDG